jgi:hypothetical protein
MRIEAVIGGLERIAATLPYSYAQWLVEDPVTFDYRVVAERIPSCADGFAIAHRTGVIGQVFRTGRAILVPDTSAHPLYDPFDSDVDWELAVPVWEGKNLSAVLNLEGRGSLDLRIDQWRAVGAIVSTIGGSIGAQRPDLKASGLVKSRRADFDSTSPGARDVPGIGARLARRGHTVLMIGHFPDEQNTGVTVCDAESQHLPLAECVMGVAARLDRIELGSTTDGPAAFERLGGWSLVEGRYELLLVKH